MRRDRTEPFCNFEQLHVLNHGCMYSTPVRTCSGFQMVMVVAEGGVCDKWSAGNSKPCRKLMLALKAWLAAYNRRYAQGMQPT